MTANNHRWVRVSHFLWIGLLLLSGLFFYIFFREHNLVLHDWLREIGLLGSESGNLGNFASQYLPLILLDSLPDGLWMFCLAFTLLLVWNLKISRNLIFWYVTALAIGLSYEILQSTSLIPGTFDFNDLIFIFIGGLLPLLIVYRLQKDRKVVKQDLF